MAIQTTRWSPDTCNCVILYQWDDALPDDQRVHIPVPSIAGRTITTDAAATQAALDAWNAKRDAEHAEIATSLGITVDQLRAAALAASVLLPVDDEKPVEVKISVEDAGATRIFSKACKEHAAHTFDISALHGTVLAENQKKNAAVGLVASTLAVEASEIGWALDATTRAITLSLPADKAAEQTTVEAELAKDPALVDVVVAVKA